MKNLLFIIVFLVVGCGKDGGGNNSTPIAYSVAPELETYVDDFYTQSNVYNTELHTNLSVSFQNGDLDPNQAGNQVGLCISSSLGGRVVVQREFFDSMDTLRIRSLVFHELGHCLLNRNHRTSTMWVNENSSTIRVPFSIMYPSVIPGSNSDEISFVDTNFSFYIEEMFTPDDNETIFNFANSFVYDDSENDLYFGSTYYESYSTNIDGSCNHTH